MWGFPAEDPLDVGLAVAGEEEVGDGGERALRRPVREGRKLAHRLRGVLLGADLGALERPALPEEIGQLRALRGVRPPSSITPRARVRARAAEGELAPGGRSGRG
jgi:hypothetical protein